MLIRFAENSIRAALSDTPVVFLQGARQVGKSTLVQEIADQHRGQEYLTLDSTLVHSAAASDPDGFIAGLPESVIIDEIQRVPELALAIKRSVDQNRKPGRFLLTGSANVLVLPTWGDSLAGRMELLTLWPFARREVLSRPLRSFVDDCFGSELPSSACQELLPLQMADLLVAGAYPEALSRGDLQRRASWFESYLTTILQKDVRDLANIENLTKLPQLLQLLAIRTGQLLNYAGIARDADLPQTTLKRYMALLDGVFLVKTIPPWFGNQSKRLVKSPKVMMTDSGLACHLLGYSSEQLCANRGAVGPILESFVGMELLKDMGWSESKVGMFHFRTSNGHGVDFVLEDRAGRIVGIEVKAAATVRDSDLKGMRALAELTGSRFHRGIVLHTGSEVVPFAANIHTRPLTDLWLSS